MSQNSSNLNSELKRLLIVGAGPVGLAAALFVSSNPLVNVRIIEKNPDPRVMIGSKALLINPRTMSLLEGYPLQKKLLEASLKIQSTQMRNYENNQLITENCFAQAIKRFTKYPNLYIYPQCETEAVLEESVNKLGIKVERGIQLQNIANIQKGVAVKLKNNSQEQIYDYVLAADGAHSTVRKALKISFPGETLQDKLYVADYINQGEPLHKAKFHFGKTNTLIFIPVIRNIVRIVANQSNYLKGAQQKLKLGQCVWESEFKVNNRYAERMSEGNVFLAGDAAHVHAPIGGRGMNLGIEDVFVFSYLLKDNKLSEYNRLRQPVVKDFVEKIMKASILVKQERGWFKYLYPYVMKIGATFFKTKQAQFVAGLDHEVPYLPKL